MKYPFIVYWYNKRIPKWQYCKTLEKAMKYKKLLSSQGIYRVWIAKDI